MTSHQALTGLLLVLALGACAVQLDEPTRSDPLGSAGTTSSAGRGGTTSSTGKGGSTSSAGNPGSGGATSSGGKGGAAGSTSAGSGGQASGGQTTAGAGGDDNGGSSGSGSGGTQGTLSCAGLPAWAADTNPVPALQPGDAFTYMNQRFELAGASPVTYWNGECPPEASRPTWCDTNYAFSGPTPCE